MWTTSSSTEHKRRVASQHNFDSVNSGGFSSALCYLLWTPASHPWNVWVLFPNGSTSSPKPAMVLFLMLWMCLFVSLYWKKYFFHCSSRFVHGLSNKLEKPTQIPPKLYLTPCIQLHLDNIIQTFQAWDECPNICLKPGWSGWLVCMLWVTIYPGS